MNDSTDVAKNCEIEHCLQSWFSSRFFLRLCVITMVTSNNNSHLIARHCVDKAANDLNLQFKLRAFMLHPQNNGCLSFGVCVRERRQRLLVEVAILQCTSQIDVKCIRINGITDVVHSRFVVHAPRAHTHTQTLQTLIHWKFNCEYAAASHSNACVRMYTRTTFPFRILCCVPHLNAKLLSAFNFMRYITLNLSDSFVVRSLRQTVPTLSTFIPCVFSFSLSRSSFQLLCHSFDLVWLLALVCVRDAIHI